MHFARLWDADNKHIPQQFCQRNCHAFRHLIDVRARDVAALALLHTFIAEPPCQDFSGEGLGIGLRGARGCFLVYTLHCICRAKPGVAILENIVSFYNHNKGKLLRETVRTLKDAGFYVTWGIVNALNMGLPHSRASGHSPSGGKSMAGGALGGGEKVV